MDIAALYRLYQQYPLISTDTRKIAPGSLYFALRGERFDGNSFAAMALRNGAAFAIVSDPMLTQPGMLYVEDTLKALQDLARYHRRQLDVPVLALTGSNGKTTTKELATAVLSKKFKVHATPGNLNNHIGVPLTLLGAQPDTEMIVCEMGANHPGEIAFLCSIAEPTHGCITNIGQAHLEGFGSIEGVQQAKGELYRHLESKGGVVFVNTDDLRLRSLGQTLTTQKVTYGFDETGYPDIHFNYRVSPDHSGFLLENQTGTVHIQSTLFGQYNASNMLAAYVFGIYFQVDTNLIVDSLCSFVSSANRSEVLEYRHCTIVKDAYNANPSSMELAIRAFAERYPNGWVVLGDMKEVGSSSDVAHSQILDLAVSFSFARIILVGDHFERACNAAIRKDPRVSGFADIERLREQWNWEACAGQSILLKGSRSMGLEQLLDPAINP